MSEDIWLYTTTMHDFFRFAIASDDASELWLSTNQDPDKKQLIARAKAWTNKNELNKYPDQIS